MGTSSINTRRMLAAAMLLMATTVQGAADDKPIAILVQGADAFKRSHSKAYCESGGNTTYTIDGVYTLTNPRYETYTKRGQSSLRGWAVGKACGRGYLIINGRA